LKEDKLIEKIFSDHIKELSACFNGKKRAILLEILVNSEIPIGAGLGSSAAYSIAVGGALYLGVHMVVGNLAELELAHVRQKVRDYADVMERLIHTNPSGVDVAISLNGGMLKFVKGQTPAENQIKLIESPQASAVEMILVNTNKPRNSKSTIEAVMRLRDNENDRFKAIMDQMGTVTDQVIGLYTDKDPKSMDLLYSLIE